MQLKLSLIEPVGTNPTDVASARRSTTPDSGGGGGSGGIVHGDLADHARRKYLNYALSVITSRAIPDVRDGLKPVHRRIIYTMFEELRLTHDSRHRKSAKVVGDVIGKFHPHGDTAVYDAMVRLAQDFAMRAPLVDGQGNFGSIDGDSAAAYRYTEARLTKIASELISEIRADTVDFRPTYDGQGQEPIVLPARFPQILVNGGTGIAVGMATSIPPHNLSEVVKACVRMIDDPKLTVAKLMGSVRGPDFPTGGQLVASRAEIRKAYEDGKGSFKLRGSWKVETDKKGDQKLVITEVPYAVDKSSLVEEIGNIILKKKLPVLVGVQDLSTTDIRVECELAGNGEIDPELVMAYLFKHTRLQTTVKIDFTCLVPTENPEVGAPARLGLRDILRYFLDFRLLTVRRRYEFELRKLEARIHILEGFEIIFDDLDHAIRIIRRSEGRADAGKKLQTTFGLSEIQSDAILDTRLYRIAKLEILKIREELAEKRKQAKTIRTILKSKAKQWAVVKSELQAIDVEFSDKRRTRISDEDITEDFTAESFIPDEDAVVLVTRDGWVKRQRSINPETTRIREGDAVGSLLAGSTRECVVFFSSLGSAYVCRINEIPATAGHGVPVQQLFKFKDGERVVGATTTDPRFMEELAHEKPNLGEEYEEPYPHFIAVSKGGMALRFSLWPHKEPSTSRGRLFGRLKSGDEFLSVFQVYAEDDVCALSKSSRFLIANVMEVNLLAGAGKGVTLIKLEKDDQLVGAFVGSMNVSFTKTTGGVQKLKSGSRQATGRGGKGRPLMSRGKVKALTYPAPTAPVFEDEPANKTKTGRKKR